jgi:hypothetical protein
VISALGEPIVLSLFGNQWGGAVGTFQILAFSIPFLMLQRVALTMGHSLGGPAFAVRATWSRWWFPPVAQPLVSAIVWKELLWRSSPQPGSVP